MALAGAPQTSVGPDWGREDPSPAWGPLTLAGIQPLGLDPTPAHTHAHRARPRRGQDPQTHTPCRFLLWRGVWFLQLRFLL